MNGNLRPAESTVEAKKTDCKEVSDSGSRTKELPAKVSA